MLDPFYLVVDDAAWLERLLPAAASGWCSCGSRTGQRRRSA